jgi:hypothetical protein
VKQKKNDDEASDVDEDDDSGEEEAAEEEEQVVVCIQSITKLYQKLLFFRMNSSLQFHKKSSID